jgi:hypothetical protein
MNFSPHFSTIFNINNPPDLNIAILLFRVTFLYVLAVSLLRRVLYHLK